MMHPTLSAPWAILPERLTQLQSYLEAKYAANPASMFIQMNAAQEGNDPGYSIENGVAIISIMGVLSKNADWWSGGTAMNDAKAAFRSALDDPAVSSILLYIDSPGGTVDGTQELASIIESARGKKPIIAYTDGLMASGAYWIGSSADKIYISGDTVTVGSIGVVAAHVDISNLEERWGVKVTEITAGKYKRINSAHAPLSEEGRSYIQDQVDHLYAVFVDNVARVRGVSTEKALAMADGKLFIGRQAVDVGLVDGMATLEQIITDLKEEQMTQDELKSKFPAVYQAILDEGKAIGLAQGKEEGALQERSRIQAVEAQSLPGHEALIATMKFDGKTTGEQAAIAILAAEKSQRETMLSKIKTDSPQVISHDNPPVFEHPKVNNDDRPVEEIAKEKWDSDKELRAEFGNDFDRYLAYVVASEEKKFKVLSK
ncbi:MAG: putative signal peptide peptidase SppA [Syntrophus sp. PtaB.Bin001]|nr:MAG: putative signal peptide peptidase SppA [Syntrophus sp. PtaB.Bin001]